MEGRVYRVPLRDQEPAVVELTLRDIGGKPLSQLAIENVLDVFALAELPDLATQMRHETDAFVPRIRIAVADIPVGPAWKRFLEDLTGVGGDRVPLSFRQLIAEEVSRRGPGREVVGAWEGVAPLPFAFGAAKVRGQHLEVANEPASIDGRRAVGRASARPAPKPPKPPTAPRGRAPSQEDAERAAFISEVALERLGPAGENGLSEPVLVAAIRHRGKERYGDLLPTEITAVLKNLMERKRLRRVSGRWSCPPRW